MAALTSERIRAAASRIGTMAQTPEDLETARDLLVREMMAIEEAQRIPRIAVDDLADVLAAAAIEDESEPESVAGAPFPCATCAPSTSSPLRNRQEEPLLRRQRRALPPREPVH